MLEERALSGQGPDQQHGLGVVRAEVRRAVHQQEALVAQVAGLLAHVGVLVAAVVVRHVGRAQVALREHRVCSKLHRVRPRH